MQCQQFLNADLLSAAIKAYAEKLREAVTKTFLLLEGQFLLTGQLSGQLFIDDVVSSTKPAWNHNFSNTTLSV